MAGYVQEGVSLNHKKSELLLVIAITSSDREHLSSTPVVKTEVSLLLIRGGGDCMSSPLAKGNRANQTLPPPPSV